MQIEFTISAITYTTETVNYRFLHDRVQQAAYSLIPENQEKATHIKIGQLLQQNFSESEKEEKLFDIVGHCTGFAIGPNHTR
jgi:predicted ATPase